MIRARHTFGGRLLAGFYSGHKLDRAFDGVHLQGEVCDSGGPVLLVANHFSWWDGFIQYRLNRATYRRRLHVMMLEEQLRRFMVLNRCGAFSVRKNSREAVQSLDYCLELLGDPENLVLIFPQGEVQSLHTDPIRFQSGLGYLLRRAPENTQLLFNVNLTDYLSRPRPSLTIYHSRYDPQQGRSAGEVERAFNRFYQSCKRRQCER